MTKTTSKTLGALAARSTKFVDALGGEVVTSHNNTVDASYWRRVDGSAYSYGLAYSTLRPHVGPWVWTSEIVFEVDDDGA